MKRIVVVLAALALIACTETKQSSQPTMTDKEVRQANRLPRQTARDMSSPVKALGCTWRVSLEPKRITLPSELLASCDGLPAGRAYVVGIDSRMPAEGVDTDVRMILQISAPGLSRRVTVAFVESLGNRVHFHGEVEGRVPNSHDVEVRLSLIGCEDAAGKPAACVIDSAGLSVLASGPR